MRACAKACERGLYDAFTKTQPPFVSGLNEGEAMIDYAQTLQVVRELLERHDRAGLLTHDPGVVLVGGNALMAHQIRMASGDVDLYFPHYSADIVREVEREGQATYGPNFRRDVTATDLMSRLPRICGAWF